MPAIVRGLESRRRHMARRRLEGLERVLGVNALFATAYGNVGSSIYYALGLVASLRARPDPARLHHHGVLLLLHRRQLRRGDRDVPRGGRLVELRAPRVQRVLVVLRGLGPDAHLHRSRSRSRRSSCRTTSAALFWDRELHDGARATSSPARVVIVAAGRDQRRRREGVDRHQRLRSRSSTSSPSCCWSLIGAVLVLSPERSSTTSSSAPRRRGRTSSSRSRSACSPTRASRRSRTWPRRPRTRRTTIPAAINRVRIAVFAIYFTLPAVALSALPVDASATASTRRSSASPRRRAASRATRCSASSSRSTSGRSRRPASSTSACSPRRSCSSPPTPAIIGVSRLVYSMGIHRQMPDALRRLHPRYRTPWIGILVFSGGRDRR